MSRLIYENIDGPNNKTGENKKLDKAKETIHDLEADMVAINEHRIVRLSCEVLWKYPHIYALELRSICSACERKFIYQSSTYVKKARKDTDGTIVRRDATTVQNCGHDSDCPHFKYAAKVSTV